MILRALFMSEIEQYAFFIDDKGLKNKNSCVGDFDTVSEWSDINGKLWFP